MGFPETFVPKKNLPYAGESDEGGKPVFSTLFQMLGNIKRQVPLGKIALLCEGDCYAFFADFARDRRTVSLVQSSCEALPLFALPESVACAVVMGGGGLVRAARYFCRVRQIPCFVIIREASCDGVFEETGEITIDGVPSVCPLQRGSIYCDRTLVVGYERAFALNLLTRLALFEGRALRALCGREEDDSLLSLFSTRRERKEEILSLRMACAKAERGEGFLLAQRVGEWQAYRQLLSAYEAFLRHGKPREYFVPDYRARCMRAGVGEEGYLRVKVPTVEEYRSRAFRLERMKTQLLRELQLLLDCLRADRRTFLALGGEEGETNALSALYCLPEYAPEGLCAIMRDFGYLEEKV